MNRGRILDAWRRKREAGALLQGGPSGPDFVTLSYLDRRDLQKLDVKNRALVAGLLPIRDSNRWSQNESIAAVGRFPELPVIADVCASDPLRLIDSFLKELKELGVAGVRNYPSIGIIDGSFRKSLEESGLGYPKEVAMIATASKLDLLTIATAYTPDDARAMVEAGADVVVAHPGFGPVAAVGDIVSAAREARKGILVFSAASTGGVDGIQSEA